MFVISYGNCNLNFLNSGSWINTSLCHWSKEVPPAWVVVSSSLFGCRRSPRRKRDCTVRPRNAREMDCGPFSVKSSGGISFSFSQMSYPHTTWPRWKLTLHWAYPGLRKKPETAYTLTLTQAGRQGDLRSFPEPTERCWAGWPRWFGRQVSKWELFRTQGRALIYFPFCSFNPEKERELCVRERLAEDKVARAESLLRNYGLREPRRLSVASGPGSRIRPAGGASAASRGLRSPFHLQSQIFRWS